MPTKRNRGAIVIIVPDRELQVFTATGKLDHTTILRASEIAYEKGSSIKLTGHKNTKRHRATIRKVTLGKRARRSNSDSDQIITYSFAKTT